MAFALERPPRGGARLLCRAGIPAELDPASRDGRHLGVAVRALELRQGGRRRVLAAGDALLNGRPGWYGPESGDGQCWRWTDGAALLPPALFAGLADAPLTLAVTLHAAAPVLLAPPGRAA